LWSTSFGLSAEVLRTASPAVLSVGRFVIGLLILVPIAARRSGFAITLRQPRTVLLGLLGVALYYSLTNVGLEFTTPGTAALSNAALPALTAISGLLILRERLGLRTIIGLVLATAGVVIVAGSGPGLDLGVVLCLIGLASYALVLFNYGAERLPAAVTGVMTAAIPALGYLFALLLGEQPDAITALGGGIALIGVLIASWATPSIDSSPPGSALPASDEDSDIDTAAGNRLKDRNWQERQLMGWE
jgi:drug/metabolite transporter (DMT)-like permease